jgi:hypothetical protein
MGLAADAHFTISTGGTNLGHGAVRAIYQSEAEELPFTLLNGTVMFWQY